MTAKVQLNYRLNEDRFRAEFKRGDKVVDYKYLTVPEWEALDEFYHLPLAEGENLTIPAGFLFESIEEQSIAMDMESNFYQMLKSLLGK